MNGPLSKIKDTDDLIVSILRNKDQHTICLLIISQKHQPALISDFRFQISSLPICLLLTVSSPADWISQDNFQIVSPRKLR